MEILRIWNGGMSFHGGLLGVLGAFWYYARSRGRSFLEVSGLCCAAGARKAFFSAVWAISSTANSGGKVSDASGPWSFRRGPLPRHPSQLYEAAWEGMVLFMVLWIFSGKPRKPGAVSGLFSSRAGLFRFHVEFCARARRSWDIWPLAG